RTLAAELARLRSLEKDRNTAGVVVVIGDLGGGWASAEELHAALLRLRHAKKHVYAYLVEAHTRGSYVAAAAERIYPGPARGIRLVGLSSTITFFKRLGDKLGVRADFVKIAEYKSAPETFTRDSSTEPAREQRQALLDDVFGNLVSQVAAARHVKPDQVRTWI